MTAKIVAISQPTFLPWIGWFDLADQVDEFVILDDVAFSKQSWQQRNRIRTRNGLEFLSVPAKTAGRLGQSILDCELVDQLFVTKMVKTLQANYVKAPFFETFFDDFSDTLISGANTSRLAELNCALIFWMATKLGVTTPMIRSSTLGVRGERGERVAAICEYVGAKRYLSPAGAESYLIEDNEAFEKRDIEVLIQMYEHPEYVQRFTPFIPYASALDLIFNVGPQAGEAMRSGRRLARPLNNSFLSHPEVMYHEN
jgi:hypothetical protein